VRHLLQIQLAMLYVVENSENSDDSKLLEAYTSLLVQDTTQMTQEAKEDRDKALALMAKKLFGNQPDMSSVKAFFTCEALLWPCVYIRYRIHPF
jgi:hypothetical protein